MFATIMATSCRRLEGNQKPCRLGGPGGTTGESLSAAETDPEAPQETKLTEFNLGRVRELSRICQLIVINGEPAFISGPWIPTRGVGSQVSRTSDWRRASPHRQLGFGRRPRIASAVRHVITSAHPLLSNFYPRQAQQRRLLERPAGRKSSTAGDERKLS